MGTAVDPNDAPREEKADDTAAFHVHLDVCDRCRSCPFDLCPTGQPLLEKAAATAAANAKNRLGPGGPS